MRGHSFLSKTNHLRTLLQASWLSLWIPFYDLHAIHTFAGKVVSAAVGVHAIAHITRWAPGVYVTQWRTLEPSTRASLSAIPI